MFDAEYKSMAIANKILYSRRCFSHMQLAVLGNWRRGFLLACLPIATTMSDLKR